MRADEAINIYFDQITKVARAKHHHKSTASKTLLEQARQFVTWCEQQRIQEPALYIRFRIEGAYRRRYRLPFRQLISERMAEEWRTWACEKYRVQVWTDKMHASISPDYATYVKGLRVLVPAMETYQFNHVREGRSELCMHTTEFSGGFHPKSRVCPSCPTAILCANKLVQDHGFDVVALRRGQLNLLPQAVAAAAIA